MVISTPLFLIPETSSLTGRIGQCSSSFSGSGVACGKISRMNPVLVFLAGNDNSARLDAGRFYDDPLIFADFFETGKTTSQSGSSSSASGAQMNRSRLREPHGPVPLLFQGPSRKRGGLGEVAPEQSPDSQPLPLHSAARLGYAGQSLRTGAELEVSNHG